MWMMESRKNCCAGAVLNSARKGIKVLNLFAGMRHLMVGKIVVWEL